MGIGETMRNAFIPAVVRRGKSRQKLYREITIQKQYYCNVSPTRWVRRRIPTAYGVSIDEFLGSSNSIRSSISPTDPTRWADCECAGTIALRRSASARKRIQFTEGCKVSFRGGYALAYGHT
eukprot:1350559-Rhodomonas_salina.1